MFYLIREWYQGIRRSQQAEAWLKIAETQEGLIAIHDLANRYHMLTSHGGDAFSEGQRSVVAYILSQINLSPAEMTRMKLTETEPNEEE